MTICSMSVFCVGVGLVKRIHTLFGRNAQVVYELQVGEEVEGVRQEVRDVKGEEKGEVKVEARVDGMNDGHSSDLSHAVHVQCTTMR